MWPRRKVSALSVSLDMVSSYAAAREKVGERDRYAWEIETFEIARE